MNVAQNKWFEQKDLDKLNYIAVYQYLDELTLQGYTSLQIEQILKLGKVKYDKLNKKNGR